MVLLRYEAITVLVITSIVVFPMVYALEIIIK